MRKMLLFSMSLLAAGALVAQDPEEHIFEFEFTFGMHGDSYVNSKTGVVKHEVDHDKWAEGTISFTASEKKELWDMLEVMDFYSLPNKYKLRAPKAPVMPDTAYDEEPENDTYRRKHVEVRKGVRFITLYPADENQKPIVFTEKPKKPTLHTIKMKHGVEYTLSIHSKEVGHEHTVSWNSVYLPANFEDPTHEELMRFGKFLADLMRTKPGWKALPPSKIIYD